MRTIATLLLIALSSSALAQQDSLVVDDTGFVGINIKADDVVTLGQPNRILGQTEGSNWRYSSGYEGTVATGGLFTPPIGTESRVQLGTSDLQNAESIRSQ